MKKKIKRNGKNKGNKIIYKEEYVIIIRKN